MLQPYLAHENSQASRVTHLEELRHGHRPRFAVAIDDESEDGNKRQQRRLKLAPPSNAKARVVEDLEQPDGGDEPRRPHAIRRTHQIPPRGTPRREKVAGSSRIFADPQCDDDDEQARDDDDQPVERRHGRSLANA